MRMFNVIPKPYVAPKPGVRAFIDFEFNGKNGEMLSAAIVTDTGAEWYEVVEHNPADLVPWVMENVVPHFNKAPISRAAFNASFEEFINQFGYVEFLYNAHADRRYLDSLTAYVKMPLFRCIRDGFLSAKQSLTPHNALADARAIVAFVCGSDEPIPELPHGPTPRQMFKAMWDKGYHFDARDVNLRVALVQSYEGKPYGHRAQLEVAAIHHGMDIIDMVHRDPKAVFHEGRIEITPINNRSNASITPMHSTIELPFYFYTRQEQKA
jgi:hypothetical protein